MTELVSSDNNVLHKELETFDFANSPVDPVELANEMIQFMNDNNGIGLAANQLGYPYRVFVMRTAPEATVCFNPVITYSSEEKIVLDEGCLTYPGLYIKIRRPKIIRVRYKDVKGEVQTKTFDGITARCFQHELDHLNGVVFTERASKFHLDKARTKQKNLMRKLKKQVDKPQLWSYNT